MMGEYWEAAFAVCLIISLDGFHKLNHIGHYCLGALDPDKYPQIRDENTQSCEQTNKWANKHRCLAYIFIIDRF